MRKNDRPYMTIHCTHRHAALINIAGAVTQQPSQSIIEAAIRDWLAGGQKVVLVDTDNLTTKAVKLQKNEWKAVKAAAIEHDCNIYDVINSALTAWAAKNAEIVKIYDYAAALRGDSHGDHAQN